MSYVSKYDTKFITFLNRKYGTNFSYFDDYILWLYDKKSHDKEKYYNQLESDMWEYSDFQTGSQRKRSGVINEKRK